MTVTVTSASPEIEISSSESGAVADAGMDAQGIESSGAAKTVTYTVNNSGTGTLNLTGTPTAINLVNVTTPTITAPVSVTVAPGASTTFTVTYTPTLPGAFSFDLDVPNNDANENPYNFNVFGTALDTEAPVFAGVPANINVPTDTGLTTAVVSFTAPTASDNVDGALTPVLVTSPTAGLESGDAFPLGVTTLTYTATDAAGNAQMASFTVTVGDGESPVIASVGSTTVATSPVGASTAAVSFTTTVSDNVDAPSHFTPVFTAGGSAITSPHSFPVGVTTVTVTANDDTAGNTADPVSFTVTVTDGEAPVFAGVPANINVPTDTGLTTAVVSFTAPTASDNVDGALTPVLVTSPTAGLESGDAFPLGVTTLTYTATDAAGNAQMASFTVTVGDGESPVIASVGSTTVATSPVGASTAAVSFTTTVSDNVDAPSHFTPVFTAGGSAITSPHSFPVGVTTVTVTANDDTAGNTADPVSFTVTVTDGEAPVFAGVPANINVPTDTGLTTAVVSFTAPTASDNVDGALTPVLVTSPTAGLESGDAFPLGVTTLTYTATDAAGNAQMASFTVTVGDGESPVIASVGSTTVATSPVGASTAAVSFTTTVSDNVDAPSHFTPVFTAGGSAITSPHSFPVGVTTVTVTANDDTAGNTADPVSFTVTVTDGEAPVFAGVPANINVPTDTGLTTAVVSFTAPTASDNVDGALTPVLVTSPTAGLESGDAFPLGVTTLTYTATDAAGNAQMASFTVTVGDGESPVIASVGSTTVATSPVGASTAAVSFTTTVSDNVDAPSHFTPVFTAGGSAITSPHSFPVGVTTVTVTANDDTAGNTADPVSFTVTVTDGEAPVFAGVPANINVPTDTGLTTAVVSFTAPTASDNVDGALTPVLVTSPTAGLESGDAFPLGVTTLTYTATDAAGNAQMASFTVTVGDGESPVIASVGSTTVATSPVGASTAAVSFTTTVSDNVDAPSHFTPVFTAGGSAITSPHSFPVGVTTVTVTANDDTAGNTADPVSFTVTVTDGEAPVFAGVPANINVPTDTGLTTAVVSFTAPTASDNVDGALTPVLVTSPTAGLESGDAFPLGVTTLTYTATDAAGNAQMASFTVTVGDGESPVIASVGSTTVATSPVGASTAAVSFTTTVSDNVDAPSHFTPVFTAGGSAITSPHSFPVGVTTVTVTANDDTAGNTADPVSFTVTVTDGEAPVFAGVPANINVPTDTGLTTAVVSFTAPTASDNVDGALTPVLVTSPTAGLESGDAFPLGVTTLTYTATDAAGNAQMASFTVTVGDGESPVIASVGSTTVATSPVGASTAAVSFTTTVSDNVDAPSHFTPVFTAGGSAITSPHSFPVGVTTVTVTANDDTAGNTADPVSFTVTVTDGEAPVFAGVPANINVPTDTGLTTAVVSFTAPTASDNVDGALTPVLVTSPTAGLESGDAFPLGVTTLTYTATDAAGNAQMASFTVTVGDGESPVIASVGSTTVATSPVGASTAAVSFTTTVSDNVDAPSHFTPVFTAGGSAITSPHSFPVGVTTVTVTANDDTAGNTADPVSFTVTVTDGEAPVFAGVPANINVPTDTGLTTAVVSFTAPTASDNVDGALTPVLVTSPTAGLESGDAFPLGVTTLTYTATDAAGNAQMASFTVTVGDGESPVIASVGSTTVATSPVGASTAAVSFTTTVSDNVDAPSHFTPVFTAGGSAITSPHSFPVGVTTVTVTANDDTAGNTADPVSFTVTVTDGEAPVFAGVPANINVPTDTGLTTAVVSFTAPTASDNVDGALTPVLVTSPTAGLESGDAFPLGVTTLTYTATDAAGNAQMASFTVTVGDGESPVIASVGSTTVATSPVGASTAAVSFTTTVSDNVDAPSHFTPVFTAGGSAITSPHSFPVGVTTVTVTANDDTAGNTADPVSFTVTVTDGEAPVFAGVPANINVPTDTGLTTAVVSFTAPTASDNVDGALTPVLVTSPTAGLESGDAFPLGVTTLTYTATDAAGNAQMASFTVTVGDGESPVIASVGSTTVATSPVGASTAAVSFTTTVSDNVDAPSHFTPVFTAGGSAITSPHSFPVGVTTVTVTANDDTAGNTADPVSFTVTVTDGEAPVFAGVPANINVPTDTGLTTAVVSFTAPTASDNVDGALTPVLVTSPTAGLESGDAFPLGVTTLTYTATDAAGNAQMASFTVTVGDGESPVFTFFPSDITQSVDFPATTAVVNWSEPSVTDNVGDEVSVVQTRGPVSGAEFPVGTTIVTYTATDVAGNITTQSFTVSITTLAPGTVTFVVNADADGTYNIQSPEPALNKAIVASSGIGRSSAIALRPGVFPVTFATPNGIGVESAQCSAGGSTLSGETQSGTVAITSGSSVTCTIKTQNSVKETVAQIGAFIDSRSQLILQNQPSRGRRIDRLEGRYRNNGGVSGFGLALMNDKIPFAVQLGTNDISFSYSLRQSRAAGTASTITGDVTSVLGAFGIIPSYRDEDTSPLFPKKNVGTTATKVDPKDTTNIVSKSSSNLTFGIKELSAEDTQNLSTSDELEALPFDIWAAGQVGQFETGNDKGSFVVVHIGADYLIKPRVLLGLSVQGDWTNIDGQSTGSRAEGFGFLITPYVTAKLSESFYFDARAGWGKADNDISPFGTYTDSFDSERWIATAALIGTWELNGFNISPEARLSYFKEISDSYTDSLNVLLPSVEVETGTFEFGPTFSKNFITDKGSIYSPFLSVAGVWTFSEKNSAANLANQADLANQGLRARLEAGVGIQNHNGSSLNFSANYDGIGDNNFASWGGTLRFDYQF